jgi:glucan 1,3-beta-glucosidase
MAPREPGKPSKRRKQRDEEEEDEAARRQHRRHQAKRKRPSSAPHGHHSSRPHTSSDQSRSDRRSQPLSLDALAELNKQNAKRKKTGRVQQPERLMQDDYEAIGKAYQAEKARKQHRKRDKRRVVSGALLEEGQGQRRRRRGEDSDPSFDKYEEYLARRNRRRRKRLCESPLYTHILATDMAR